MLKLKFWLLYTVLIQTSFLPVSIQAARRSYNLLKMSWSIVPQAFWRSFKFFFGHFLPFPLIFSPCTWPFSEECLVSYLGPRCEAEKRFICFLLFLILRGRGSGYMWLTKWEAAQADVRSCSVVIKHKNSLYSGSMTNMMILTVQSCAEVFNQTSFLYIFLPRSQTFL